MHNDSLPPSDRDTDTAVLDTPKSDGHHLANAVINRARQQVSGDIVNNATKDLPDNQRSAIRRFHAYYAEKALTLEEAAKKIKFAGETLSLVFNGNYGAKLDSVVDAMEKFLRLQEARGEKLPFIETALTKRIFRVCETAVVQQKILLIIGDGQIGKSASLKEYAREHNHGNTIYTCVPAGGLLTNYLVNCAKALRISPNQRMCILRQKIKDSIDDRMLLIVDELHRTVDDQASSKAVQTIEFVREIFDEKSCGVVGAATKVFRDEMEDGGYQKILRQFKRRGFSIQLPSISTPEDLNKFAEHYGLAPAAGEARRIQTELNEKEALGRWLMRLHGGAKIAADRKQTMEWAHVLSAHKGLLALEGGVA